MKNKSIIILCLILFLSTDLLAQEVKFGKVSKKELEETFYAKDTSANAVVLYKKRRTYYEYNQSTGWILMTEVHERIKLYNKDGFDYATKKIGLYTYGGEDEKLTIKAYTYNLEGGKVEKTKLGKNGIFKEKQSEYWTSQNFTLPNLKEGCIVEWKYTLSSPFATSISDVICQYDIPIKYLVAKIQIPERFDFKFLSSRYYHIKVNKSAVQKNYTLTSTSRTTTSRSGLSSVNSNVSNNSVSLKENTYSILEKDIPTLISEPYVNNINNYRAKIKFEISAYKPPNGIYKYYNTTWEDVTKTIYDSSYFGIQLAKKNHFKDDLKNITNDISSLSEKMDIIFNFVKNKIKWNEINRLYTSIDGIKKAYRDGVGNSSEINLTLVAMLKEAGISANPVLISTRSHGIPLFPTKDGYNYVIAGVEIQNEIILLDATEKYSIPNVLPRRVLNWKGRLIRENGTSTTIDLYPKKYSTKKISLSVKLDSEGGVTGLMKTNYSNLNALEYREKYLSLTDDEIISEIESRNNDIEIDKFRISNKTDLNKQVVEMLMFSGENQADVIGDKIYVSPLLFLTVNENPFKLEKRIYPIDYGSAWKNILSISIQIPKGFEVESIPQDISLELPENIGQYSMTSKLEGDKILITSTTNINNALIGAIHYKSLKEFYKKAIDHQLEKIVLVTSKP